MTNRWFTDSAASGPAAISSALTVQEQKTLTTILTFAIDPENLDRELMHALDAKGTTIIDTSTGRKEAPLTEAMRAAISADKGIRLWHNHPSESSLSHSDWWCACTSANLEVLAVTIRGSMFVGRATGWNPGKPTEPTRTPP